MDRDESGNSSRALDLGRRATEGATAFFFAQWAAKIVAIIGSIVLVRLLVSPGVYGLIGIATTVPGLVMIGNFTGVNSGLTRYLSLYKIQRDSNAIWSSFWSAITVKVTTGVALSLVAYFLAAPLAALIGKPSALPFFQIASPLPFVWTIDISLKSTCVSLDRSRAYAYLQIWNEVLLTSFPIVAVLLGFGALGALLGMVAANYVYILTALAVTVGIVLGETESGKRTVTLAPTVKKLFKFGLPLGISNSFGTFSGQVVNLIIAKFVSLDVYGLYTVAQSSSTFLSYISDPVTTMIFPAFSRINGEKEHDLLQSVFRQSVRYPSMILLPTALALAIFAEPTMIFLFGSAYSGAGLILSILCIVSIFYGLGGSSATSLISAQGATTFVGALAVLGNLVDMGVASITVPIIGLVGYLFIWAAVERWPMYVLTMRKAKKAYGTPLRFSYIDRIYLALILSGLTSFGILYLDLPPLLKVLAGAATIAVSYSVFLILLRGVESSDLKNFRSMLATQPKVSRIISPLISALEKTSHAITRENKSDQ